MQTNTKNLMQLHSVGIMTDEGFTCGYCMKIKSNFGSKNVTYSNNETVKTCEECCVLLSNVKGVKIQ